MQRKIITIQDLSCTGRCSLTVALPVLSALGIETAVVPTGVYSTHTGGFQNPYRLDCTKDLMPILAHWKRENVTADAVYAGYLASVSQMEQVETYAKELGNLPLYLDPVMGDNGRLYSGFNQEYIEAMRHFIKKAYMLFPNITEACAILDIPYKEVQAEGEIRKLVDQLLLKGPKKVLLTGIESKDGKMIGNCFGEEDRFWILWNRKTAGHFHGTGDLFASAVIGGLLNDWPVEEAVALASDFTAASIKKTMGFPYEERFGVRFEQCMSMLTVKIGKEG
ncbi:MAG: pyridoxamine kinase [Lachnospiraceae bacterium]|nr:pyridoxamine kinase [Lachnospiraceae bacterium]